jgi:hypothetical protein
MHQILGAALFNVPSAWVGSYYGRVTQQGTCTNIVLPPSVCVLHTHIRTFSRHVRLFVCICVYTRCCIMRMHAHLHVLVVY